jgi:hypothetical protein
MATRLLQYSSIASGMSLRRSIILRGDIHTTIRSISGQLRLGRVARPPSRSCISLALISMHATAMTNRIRIRISGQSSDGDNLPEGECVQGLAAPAMACNDAAARVAHSLRPRSKSGPIRSAVRASCSLLVVKLHHCTSYHRTTCITAPAIIVGCGLGLRISDADWMVAVFQKKEGVAEAFRTARRAAGRSSRIS